MKVTQLPLIIDKKAGDILKNCLKVYFSLMLLLHIRVEIINAGPF